MVPYYPGYHWLSQNSGFSLHSGAGVTAHFHGSRGIDFPLVPPFCILRCLCSCRASHYSKTLKMGFPRLGFLQIEMVLRINKHLLILFLQPKIIWELGVLNNFSAFSHPFFPCFINGRWQKPPQGSLFPIPSRDPAPSMAVLLPSQAWGEVGVFWGKKAQRH